MMGRPALVPFLLLAIATTGPATRELSAQGAAPEKVLIELSLGRIATRTVEAYRVGDDALVPLGAFFDLAELRTTRRADSSFEAIVQPGNQPLIVNPVTHAVQLGKEKLSIQDQQLLTTPTEVYLSTAVLARVLGIEWDVSWPDLQVVVVDPSNLPLARRLRREAMLQARASRTNESEYTGLDLALERPKVDGVVFDYSVLAPSTGLAGTVYSSMLGLDVLGGSLALGLQSQGGSATAPRSETSWTGVWRENRWLSELTIGDGFATGPNGRNLRGLALSNSPYARPTTLGDVPFNGQLGAGWTVEAYRGGRLMGFDSVNALGQFSFDVPIQYGENPVDFVAYGPFGEVREFNQTYRANTDGLPAGRFEYGVSAGQCRTVLCSATGNLDLRYGLSTRWTLRAGVDQFWRDSLGNLTHPYVGAIGTLSNSFMVEAEAVGNAVLRGVVQYEPSVNLQFTAEGDHFASGVQAPILTPEGRQNQWTLSAFFRPSSQLGANYLEASLDRASTAGSDITSGRLGGSLQFADLRILPAIRFQRETGAIPQQSQTFYDLNTFLLPWTSLGKFFGQITARTTFEIQQGVGPSSASAYLGIPLLRGLRSEAGVSWTRGLPGASASLMIAAELPTVRSYTTVTGGGLNQTTGTQYVSGSAIYNPERNSVDFSANTALSRGGVTGRVFLDANGNGRFDPGEELLPNVRIVVGPVFSFSDSNGVYRVWDILPYEPTSVTVDSASLTSPLWVPAFAVARLEPSPNRYRTLDIPILPGGVIEGKVSAPAGQPTAGVAIVLRHPASGEQRVLTTFSDGTFYAIGVRPGEWDLTVDPKCLQLLKATAAPLHFTMAASPQGATVSGLEVTLH